MRRGRQTTAHERRPPAEGTQGIELWLAPVTSARVLCYEIGVVLSSELLEGISTIGGGKVALVVGAGCSVEPPTNVPVASICSREVHRRLVADGVLQAGDCADPEDLSVVADAVFTKKNSQRDVVERLLGQYDLKLAPANRGYLLAAAMLCERAIASVVTLNFDLALSSALSELGAGRIVGVIECPDDLPRQKSVNVYYLHRNANAQDPESWVLRTVTLQHEWKMHWEAIIAAKVLAAPIIVFAGLGTPVAVLLESAKLIRDALPGVKVFQVDPQDSAKSGFFKELGIDPSAYIRNGWCQFMEELSERLLKEQVVRLEQAAQRKVHDDALTSEDLSSLLRRLEALGLVKLGKLRAHWLLQDRPYCPEDLGGLGLIADLLLALALMARISGATAVIVEDGLIEFHRGRQTVAAYLVASGCGHRGKSAVEAAVDRERLHYRSRPSALNGAIIAGTSDSWMPTPPKDVVRGDVSENIVDELSDFPLVHVAELRADTSRISEMVP